MQSVMQNNKISAVFDLERGLVTSLKFTDEPVSRNWLISPEQLDRFGFADAQDSLLGKSTVRLADGPEYNTGSLNPDAVFRDSVSLCFRYDLGTIELTHRFTLVGDFFEWNICVVNHGSQSVTLDRLAHWLPVSYIMFDTIDENLYDSCSCVPSVAGDYSHIICRRRNGQGNSMVILNTGKGMRSVGSSCRYHNRFFEKSAPSLNGLILFQAVNAWSDEQIEAVPRIDWPYRCMYDRISLAPGHIFSDAYRFAVCPAGAEADTLQQAGFACVNYPSAVLTGHDVHVKIRTSSPVEAIRIYHADRNGSSLESCLKPEHLAGHADMWSLGSFSYPGERKAVIEFADHTSTFIFFPVYESLKKLIDTFCLGIFEKRFIDEPGSTDRYGYASISRQGESCAKGSLLLIHNLIQPARMDVVQQVEQNTVYYLRQRWLDDHFHAIRQYPGGFARIIDLDYLILQFFLLSKFDDSMLSIHSAQTYLKWAYLTSCERLQETAGKLERENVETRLASMISWIMVEMIQVLDQIGWTDASNHLNNLWNRHIDIQVSKVDDGTFIETEHYFDNAGISVTAETLLNAGKISEGLKAASLLLPNVAPSNDYRNFAPDRWWEAQAIMYHNLWAVMPAKAMLTAYDATGDVRYLDASYCAMMPMFYNYNWQAVSTLNILEPGDGCSSYCLTSPNLNLAKASRNRFGQSVFQDDFFTDLNIAGDDWDLGMDMIAYLLTFGQRTDLVPDDQGVRCINGTVNVIGSTMMIDSFAAYPAEYNLAALNVKIRRGNNSFIISKLVMKGDECVEAAVCRLARDAKIEIICEKAGVSSVISPVISDLTQ